MRANVLLKVFQSSRWLERCVALLLAVALCIGFTAQAEERPLAPDFALRAVDGSNLRLSEFRGEVVLLSFWAQWCGECRQALGPLDDLYSKYQRAGLKLLAINVDEDPERAASAVRNLKVSFPVLIDRDKRASLAYQVPSMPYVVLIDRDGRVQYTRGGYQSGVEREWSEQVRAQLNK